MSPDLRHYFRFPNITGQFRSHLLHIHLGVKLTGHPLDSNYNVSTLALNKPGNLELDGYWTGNRLHPGYHVRQPTATLAALLDKLI